MDINNWKNIFVSCIDPEIVATNDRTITEIPTLSIDNVNAIGVYKDGHIKWYQCKRGVPLYLLDDKSLHRPEGPAVVWTNGTKEWWLNGQLHRIGAPAVITHNGSKEWWHSGKRHCLGGPAIEYANDVANKSLAYWYHKGELHRENGPAIKYNNGHEEWYINGKLHRNDGPAIITANGDTYWCQNGKIHRSSTPAIELSNGSKFWFHNNKFYRKNRPAIEYSNGLKVWFDEDGEYIGCNIEQLPPNIRPNVICGPDAQIQEGSLLWKKTENKLRVITPIGEKDGMHSMNYIELKALLL